MSVKYTDTAIGFREVPNEISLLINISNCPYHCEGCHTSYLREDIGEELTEDTLKNILCRYYKQITCVCFLGEGNDLDALKKLVEVCNKQLLLTCLYTGSINTDKFQSIIPILDFIKIGPYVEEFGPLTSKTTNQRFYEIHHYKDGENQLVDVTSKFWK